MHVSIGALIFVTDLICFVAFFVGLKMKNKAVKILHLYILVHLAFNLDTCNNFDSDHKLFYHANKEAEKCMMPYI